MAHEKVHGFCENKCLVPVYSKDQADENIGYLKGDNCINIPSIANKFIYQPKVTGKLIIKLPCKTDSTKYHMIKFTVGINNLYGKDYGEYMVSAQLWKGSWTSNKLAVSTGKGNLSNLPIRVGSEDGYYSITIGEDTTIWEYPYINIKDVSLWLYEPTYEQWRNDWDISVGVPTGTYKLANERPNNLLNLEEEVRSTVRPIVIGGTSADNGSDAFYNLMTDGSALEVTYDEISSINKNLSEVHFYSKKYGNIVFLHGYLRWNTIPLNDTAVCFYVPTSIRPEQSYEPFSLYGEVQSDISIYMAVGNDGQVFFTNSMNIQSSAKIHFSAVYLTQW